VHPTLAVETSAQETPPAASPIHAARIDIHEKQALELPRKNRDLEK
jgi:hypothetical protein